MTDHHKCDGCGALESDRRGFLRHAAALAASALIGLGASPRDAAAAPLGRIFGSREAPAGNVRYPMPAADGASIDTENAVILVRHQAAVYAFALSCPHQNTALRWLAEDHRFQCPKHKSQYQMDGTFISGRATRNMDRLPIRLDGPAVIVDIDHVFESDKDASAWGKAFVKAG